MNNMESHMANIDNVAQYRRDYFPGRLLKIGMMVFAEGIKVYVKD